MLLPPRGYIFIALNIIRILSITSLLLVFSSNIVTLVNDVKAVNHFTAAAGNSTLLTGSGSTEINMSSITYIPGSTVPNQPAGAFWAVLNRLLIIGQVIVLFLSEIGFPAKFFNRYFPVLGKDFGLGALGVIQMLLGAAILSHRVDTFTLVSAFFLFSLGCLNTLLGLIFREGAKSKRSVTSWREQSKNILPTPVQQGINAAQTVSSHINKWNTGNSTGTMDEKKGRFGTAFGDQFASAKSGMGFGRQAERAAGLKGYLIAKPIESLPRYASTTRGGGPDAPTAPTSFGRSTSQQSVGSGTTMVNH